MSNASIPSFIPVVHKDMIVQDILSLCPEASDIMAEYGMHCFSCSIGGTETLHQGCELHGFDEDTMEALVEDLNDSIVNMPPRPQEITVTQEAAKAIAHIAKQEGYEGQGLTVQADAHGGFCMEFSKEPQKDDAKFSCKEEPDVHVFASPLTLWRIGGATIDYREQRFKLDLPEDLQCHSSCGDSCGCTE